MTLSALTAISPIDGRYSEKTTALQPLFSEFGLIRHRILVEIRWLQFLAQQTPIQPLQSMKKEAHQALETIATSFDLSAAERVKQIETTTNHDVKAVEYYLKEQCDRTPILAPYKEWLHFGCTSEDINNLSYALILKTAHKTVIEPLQLQIITHLKQFAKKFAKQPMLSRTHGQPASTTTVGKEFANTAYRLQQQLASLQSMQYQAKFSGAVGNFNAHHTAFPDLNWPQLTKQFIESFEIAYHPYTTQIEPHDRIAEYADAVSRFNRILIDFCRDIWMYIGFGYFQQTLKKEEVGSSTMPHKVNPIDFENAEGNLGLANSLFHFFSEKLPISRLQRDLSDSTVLRNLGVPFAHNLIAYQSIVKGLEKLALHPEKLNEDLSNAWEILAEPIQTLMRAHGIEAPYEKLKQFTRGKKINSAELHSFIDSLDLPDPIKKQLKQLTPHSYIGFADILASEI